MIEDIPIYKAERMGSRYVKFKCPICKTHHMHDYTEDMIPGTVVPQVANCKSTRAHPFGYGIFLEDHYAKTETKPKTRKINL